MRFLWPKSLSGLMLGGLAVIAVPLLVAILNAGLQIQQLADASRQVAGEGIGSARASEDMITEVLQLERATRLYQAAPDTRYLDAYRERNAALTDARQLLMQHLSSPQAQSALNDLGDLQNTIAAEVVATPGVSARLDAALPRFAD